MKIFSLFQDAEFVLYQSYSSVWNVSYGNLHIYPKLLHHVPELGFSESDIRSGHYIIDPREYGTGICKNSHYFH